MNTFLRRLVDSPYFPLLVLLGIMAVRAYPELKIGPTPVGSDASTSYIGAFFTYGGSFMESLRSFNLFYYLLELAKRLGFDALLTIKVMGVLIYGLFVASFFLLSRDAFRFGARFSLYGTLLFAFQLGTLRLSWDLYRNELGLAFALLGVWQGILFLRDRKPLRLPAFTLLGLLTLGTHQIVSLALVLLVVGGGLASMVSAKFGRRAAVFFILALAVAWLLVAPSVTVGSFSLWNHSAITFPNENLLPLNLAALIFLPLLGLLALIGLFGTWYPALLFLTVILAEQSFASVFLRTQGFFLWDRWMYFFAIPVAIYAILGIRIILKKVKGIPARYVLAGAILFLLWYPSLQFMLPQETLYKTSLDHHVFNLFPGSMMTNSIIANLAERDASRNFGSCVRLLGAQDAHGEPVVVEPRYRALFGYYAPNLVQYIASAPPKAGPYYLLTYGAPGDSQQLAPSFPAGCPIYIGN